MAKLIYVSNGPSTATSRMHTAASTGPRLPALLSDTSAELEQIDDRRLSKGVVCLRCRIPT